MNTLNVFLAQELVLELQYLITQFWWIRTLCAVRSLVEFSIYEVGHKNTYNSSQNIMHDSGILILTVVEKSYNYRKLTKSNPAKK